MWRWKVEEDGVGVRWGSGSREVGDDSELHL